MLTLTIAHNIFLDRHERIALANGNVIETTGVSIPVWFRHGRTSEPAKEVFCQYVLMNAQNDLPVGINKDGYTINLPSANPLAQTKRPNPKIWERMSSFELDCWKKENPTGDCSIDLLDPEEGGISSLVFKKQNKARNKSGTKFEVIHYVQILDYDVFEQTSLLDVID